MKYLTWICLFSLILIHTVDMMLTQRYVGDIWQNETFPPMQWAIRNFGIYGALWISRILIYSYVWIALLTAEKKAFFYLLLTFTTLYWTAMLPWLWTLGYVK